MENTLMKLSLVLGNEYTARMPIVPRIEALIAQTHAARNLGFDGVYAGQHYVTWPLACIQPIPLLARIAAEAGDMRVGTGIILLPLMHPVDMAEQIATLDAICGGRFVFGVGIGYEEHEFKAFGLRKQDRAKRFEESLEIIKRLWTEDEVNFAGEHFTLEHVVPTVRPTASPYPPIWFAANNDPAVRRAARVGDAWMANPHAKRVTLAAQIEVYREANDITLINVQSNDEANERWFTGSPTLRVDGVDIDPDTPQDGFNLECRTYWVDGKPTGLPPREWIERAVDAVTA
jgi:alkanesulfonate monooxygenase SsuD/methylene tetrahydromethanopterin reductase-like flavin-dependent oxidoreductase (luciferase family)